MGGSAKPPKASDDQQRNEKLSYELMKEQLRQAKKPIELPNITPPKPLLQPPPPVTLSGEAAQAAEDARRKAANRVNAAKGTIFAGETGKKPKTLL